MSVEFYKVEAVGLEATCTRGTLDDLAVHVSDLAAVEWDRFCSDNGIEAEEQIRFVCVGGVWRAFTGKPNEVYVERDGFIAQWYDIVTIPFLPYGEWSRRRTSAWSRRRTSAKSKAELDREAYLRARWYNTPKVCVDCGVEQGSAKAGDTCVEHGYHTYVRPEEQIAKLVKLYGLDWPPFMGGEK